MHRNISITSWLFVFKCVGDASREIAKYNPKPALYLKSHLAIGFVSPLFWGRGFLCSASSTNSTMFFLPFPTW